MAQYEGRSLQYVPGVVISPFYAIFQGFPGGSVVKNSPANAGNVGSIPRLGGSPGEGNDNSLQYSCLENSMDRGAWRATVPGVTQSQTRPSILALKGLSVCSLPPQSQ